MIAEGRTICNLTVGDFKPAEFPVPEGLVRELQAAVGQGQTNYPPPDGLPVLRQAIAAAIEPTSLGRMARRSSAIMPVIDNAPSTA